MSTAFRRRIRRALADPALQAALDANAERRLHGLHTAFAATADPAALRQRARAARQRSFDQMEALLARFEGRLTAHGVRVHHAADASQACRLICDLARRHGAGTVVKGKSMVSEEVGLNRALTQAGMRPLETDLGEYLVQLRGERPAHLITPAVHLRREDAAATFAGALGMPYTTDVEVMTRTVRRVLRQEFLRAGIGFSGVNLGVAETGTLCVVTNEGNARMCSTVPPVHIALMGIDRVVATLDDLADVLAVLPRSATGQGLTSYVSLIGGPRREDEADGPAERHLVLLDNGRRRMRQSPLGEALLCIRCGACQNACPVFREIGGHGYDSVYAGPIGAVLSSGLFGPARYGDLARASTLCGACAEVCPVGIDLPKLLLRARHLQVQSGPAQPAMRLGMRLFAWVLANPRRYRWGQRLGAWGLRLLPRRGGWVRHLPPPLAGWTGSRHFPAFAARTFSDRWRERRRVSPWPLRPTPRPNGPIPAAAPARGDPVERLGRAVRAAGAEFIRCGQAEAAGQVVRALRDAGVSSVLAWPAVSEIAPDALPGLEAAGIVVIEPRAAAEAPGGRPDSTAWAEADAGLTGADAALEETGSLVLTVGAGQPQAPSLLPWIHLALVRARDIVPTLADWLAGPGRPALAGGRSAVVISGPSRTADIEMTLTIGVHGPGRLVVVCLDEDAAAG